MYGISIIEAFKKAKECYPKPYHDQSMPWLPRHWRLVDAGADHDHQLVLDEWRGNNRYPYRHWGYQVDRESISELGETS